MKPTATILRLLCVSTLLGLTSACASSGQPAADYYSSSSIHYDSFPRTSYGYGTINVGRPSRY